MPPEDRAPATATARSDGGAAARRRARRPVAWRGHGATGRRVRDARRGPSGSELAAGAGPGPERPATGGAEPVDRGRGAGRAPGAERDRPDAPVAGPRRTSPTEPRLPDDVRATDLDRAMRAELRTLSAVNGETVARYLVQVGRLLDDDPEAAYANAMAAQRRAGRVAIVREVTGLAAYRTGRFAEALAELRTAKRLSGSVHLLPLIADAERGLGRPERALELAARPGGASGSPTAGAGRAGDRRLRRAARPGPARGGRRRAADCPSCSRSARPGGLASPTPTPTRCTRPAGSRRPAAGWPGRPPPTSTARPTRPSGWPSWTASASCSTSTPTRATTQTTTRVPHRRWLGPGPCSLAELSTGTPARPTVHRHPRRVGRAVSSLATGSGSTSVREADMGADMAAPEPGSDRGRCERSTKCTWSVGWRRWRPAGSCRAGTP